jgi:phenylpropionate dioxygenase-like ring-hydroxylating dioxygenase large terminal subunit
MKTEEQLRVIDLLMKRLDDGTNVDAGGHVHNPVEAYTSRDIASREWDAFFRGHPQLIGMSGDLPEPGSFMTTSDFGVPVLATRDREGRFRAFVNVCRHRGVVLEQSRRGARSRFVCPFHAWTYSNEGSLVAVPKQDHFGRVDKACMGLTELPAEERYGLLFVHPQPDATLDVDDLLGGLAEEFEAWGWDEMVPFGHDTYETPMNWKLGIDTFGETYHFASLHAQTLYPSFYGNVQTYDVFGRNHRMGLCLRSIDALRGQPREKWHVCEAALPVYFLFPNVQLNVFRRSIVSVSIYPDPNDPGRAISRVGFYGRREALEREGDELRQLVTNFGFVIRDEDFAMGARQQLGAASGAHEHVVFGRNEPALHHYHNTYREALGMPRLPLQPA